jgi:hypothetical protein
MSTTRNPARSVVEMTLARLLRMAVLLAAGLAEGAAGQNPLEVIALRHRTAEQVLPALRPLMEPGATLTGHGTQLIVRASPANVAELRRALEAIDRPLRRLSIAVRFDDVLDATTQDVATGARATSHGAGIGVDARAGLTSGAERVDQRVQLLEGGRAYIFTGQSTPVLDGSVMRATATGFEVSARLAGNTAIVELAQRSARQTLQSRRLWLKVEEIGP